MAMIVAEHARARGGSGDPRLLMSCRTRMIDGGVPTWGGPPRFMRFAVPERRS